MATSRFFAYNPIMTPPTGATQWGNVAISSDGFQIGAGGLNWYNGPDESIGYVIAHDSGPRTAASASEIISGQSFGFWRTPDLSDASFISLSEMVSRRHGSPQTFVSAISAKDWLNSNGYWSSYTLGYTNTAEIYFDPGDTSSYSGSGTTLTNIGTSGNVTGTLGTLSGVAYNSGVASGVFDFDGVADKVTFGQFNFGTTITSTAWVYPRNEASINSLMSNCGANTATNGFKMNWNSWTTTNLNMNFEAGNGSSGGTQVTGINTIVENQWQHIAYVFDKSAQTIKFYRNGVQIAQTGGGTPVANIGTNNSNWWIGSIGGNSYYMDAYLGQMRVYKSLRSTAEVLDEFNNTKSRYGL